MPKEQELRVFTARNLGVRWGKTESEVRELVRSGKLRGTYLAGKLLRISREEVLEFELRNEVSIDKR
jgi:excisionase family DNA binding protein